MVFRPLTWRVFRFRFRLRTLLLLVAAAGVALGWQTHIVNQRRAAKRTIEARGGFVDAWMPVSQHLAGGDLFCGSFVANVARQPVLRVSTLRRWLGDEPIESVLVKDDADLAWAQRIFPEAEVASLEEWER